MPDLITSSTYAERTEADRMKAKPAAATGRPLRRDRDVREYEHDTYKIKRKLKEPTACPQCGAVFHRGRWSWAPKPENAHEALCPACQRIEDKYPKGLVTLTGPYLAAREDELIGLIRNAEANEKEEHPLSRIMAIEKKKDKVVISTTDSHLARRIGSALKDAHQGELDVHYNKAEDFVRVLWSR
jgi:NMD protein affecting ribosome stability and mRNA decay